MLFSRGAGVVLALTSVVAAAPFDSTLAKRWGWGSVTHRHPWWTPTSTSTSSYLGFGKRFPGSDSNAPTCDLSNAVMPTAPTPLPSPAPGLALSHVAIGRGTQNYTCDLTNSTAIPVAVGALATLFNATCLAANSPTLLSALPNIALDLPVPAASMPDMSGHHYFTNTTTPFFNLDTDAHQYGTGAFAKTNSSAAPEGAKVGQYGKGEGAVAWLKLDARREVGGQVFQQVYRVNTAGGNPPSSCVGMESAFEVQYSAEYWLYT